jgi:hypothetical protein
MNLLEALVPSSGPIQLETMNQTVPIGPLLGICRRARGIFLERTGRRPDA